MAPKPRVCVLRTAGTNCDYETAVAFQKAGGLTEYVHINELVAGLRRLEDFKILALPGGFSYGDDLGAGKVLANELRFLLKPQLSAFLQEGKLIIGICNGFQVLVKSGLLPGSETFTQEASLIINDSGKFEDRWTYLLSGRSKCVWTRGLPEIIYLPVAHGEGKFIVKNKDVLEKLKKKGQVVLRYCDEDGNLAGYPACPSGSRDNIAGICDESGRILGLMPHPERHITALQHPRRKKTHTEIDGMMIFRNGVDYAKRYL